VAPRVEDERGFLRRFDFVANQPGTRDLGRLWVSPHELRFRGLFAPVVRDRSDVDAVWIEPMGSGDDLVGTVASASAPGPQLLFVTLPKDRERVWWALERAGWPIRGAGTPPMRPWLPLWFTCRVGPARGWFVVEPDGIRVETRGAIRTWRRPDVHEIVVPTAYLGGGYVILRTGSDGDHRLMAGRRDTLVEVLLAGGWPVRSDPRWPFRRPG